MLDDLVQLALKGLKDLTTAIVGAVTSILGALASALTAEWKIPLISPLYAKVAQAPLTTVDLVSLAVAIPANALSRLVYQRSPFPDDAALTRFKGTFSVASLTRHLPGTPATTDALPRVAETEPTDPPAGPSAVAITFGMIGLFNRAVFIFTDTWLDADPEAEDKAWLNTLALAQGWLGMVASCPWFDEAGPPGFADADGLERVAWIFQVVPNGVDSYFYVRDLRANQNPQIARNDGISGVLATFALGLANLGLTVWIGSLRKADDPGEVVANGVSLAEGLFDSIPGCFKWVSQINVPSRPEVNVVARAGLAAADVLCGATTVGLMIAELLSKEPAPPPPARGLGPLALTAT